MFLIVICSPGSAKSHWVEQEIIQFKRAHGEGSLLALIVGGTLWQAPTSRARGEDQGASAAAARAGPRRRADRRAGVTPSLSPPTCARRIGGARLARLKLVARA